MTTSSSSYPNPVSVGFVRQTSAKSAASATEQAVRMMSETAHDIRAPLASVRESVRMVQNGDLGDLNPEQCECLKSAIDRCDCIDQMIGEMMQLERLRTGSPRIRRQWTNIASIRHGIAETLHPWIAPRGIHLVWDINAAHNANVFGDAAMVRRLIVNLVANAARETPEGGSILIAVHKIASSESLQWSVVDRGRGMTESEMREISQRQVSRSGSEGLGLSICRQLSALHFSPLRIESRAGTGTAVSFRTAAGGPASVAERWSQWRVNQREPLRTPISRKEKQVILTTPSLRAEQQIRVDAPSITIQLESEGIQPKVEDRVSAGTVTLGAAMPADVAELFDALLQNRVGMFDLVYRADTRTWVWVFDANSQMVDELIDEINAEAKAKINDIRLSWTDPQSIPLDGRRTAARLTEILVRHSLATPKQHYDIESPSVQLQHSGTAELRLDQEMLRLGKRLMRQTSHLKTQARRLRPVS